MKRLALAVVLLAGCGSDKTKPIVIQQDASSPKRLSVVEGIRVNDASLIIVKDSETEQEFVLAIGETMSARAVALTQIKRDGK